jgi:anti-sigma-K factor RsiG
LHFRFRVGYTQAMDDSGMHGGFDWENAEDVTALSEEDLRDRLEALSEEERALSYRRRVLQGRIDLIRGELVERGAVALSPGDLARVLLGDSPDKETR